MAGTNDILTTLGAFREDEIRILARDTKPGRIIVGNMDMQAGGGFTIPYVMLSGQEAIALLDAAHGRAEEAVLAVKALIRLLEEEGVHPLQWPPQDMGLTETEWAVIRRLGSTDG